MSKYRTTKKAIKEIYGSRILCIPYADLQSLLNCEDPFAYSTRAEGWACDYYEIPRGICISTGYSPIGKAIPYEFRKKWEDAARKICEETWVWSERKPRLDGLLADFAGEVEANFFRKRRTA